MVFARPVFLFASFAFILGLAAILAAWAFQLIGGYQPCALCLEQRTPYYIGLPLLLCGLVLYYRRGDFIFPRLLFGCFGFVMLYGLGLAVYHAGAEWAFWQGPSDCGSTGAYSTETAGDLLSQIQGLRLVSCTEAALRVFGLSFAGWNAVVSLLLAGFGFLAAFWPKKPL